MNIVLIIIAVLIVIVIGMYNRLIRMRVRSQEAWADIDVQLKRRYDLIPNLVETVQGYAQHERETLQEVLEARAKATQVNLDLGNVSAADMESFAGAERGLTSALGKLLAVAESYPDLKANENFLELQRELSDTENKIQSARRFYNTNVRDFNIVVQTFPSSLIAQLFGFNNIHFFELPVDSEEREPVKVSFDNESE
jgi:LemA protein